MADEGMTGMEMRALSTIMQRAALARGLGETFGGDRDLYDTLGYKRELRFEDYERMYRRGDIAAKIVDLPAKTTWRRAPQIVAEGSFVEDFEQLNNRLRLLHYMERADRIGRIGEYSVMLIGVADGEELSTPLESLNAAEEIIYVSVFSQNNADIQEWEGDPTSPRFGRPLIYKLTMNDSSTVSGTQRTKSVMTKEVHHSRVIHIAEDLLEDDVFGTPALRRVYNRLEDIQKLAGCSAEVFWLSVAGLWHADLDPDVEPLPGELEDFEEKMVEAFHGLRRVLQSRGITLENIGGGDVDPSSTYEMQRQLISAASEIPERVLFGSERGQLAADQDQREWQARIASRQEQFAEPVVLRGFLDRLIKLGAMEDPVDGYDIIWPPLGEPTESERATVAKDFASAVSSYAPAGAPEMVVPLWEFREAFLGLPAEIPDPPESWVDPFDALTPEPGDDDGVADAE